MENELNSGKEMNKIDSAKPEIALRCAKAAILLSNLSHRCPKSPDSTPTAAADEDGEKVWELKKELVRERLKNKKMRIVSLAELFLQIAVLLSLWTICVFIAFDSL